MESYFFSKRAMKISHRYYMVLLMISSFCSSCISDDAFSNFDVDLSCPTKIMIVPDIQNYTDEPSRFKFILSISDYYNDNASEYAACFQVGDITNKNQIWQYQNAYDFFFSRFPDEHEPFFCLGNHDYGEEGKSKTRLSNIPDIMRAKFDFRYEESDYENYVRYLTIGDTKYAVLDLEFAPRNEAIDWANDVIQKYSKTPFILLTHVFTNIYGQIHDFTDDSVYHPGSQKSYYMGGDYINDSMEVFNKVIKDNENVKMVICGHTLIPNFIQVTSKQNSKGNNVYIITVNYQHYTEGGNGYVGILSFDENGYNIKSFSTVERKFGPIDISFGP